MANGAANLEALVSSITQLGDESSATAAVMGPALRKAMQQQAKKLAKERARNDDAPRSEEEDRYYTAPRAPPISGRRPSHPSQEEER